MLCVALFNGCLRLGLMVILYFLDPVGYVCLDTRPNHAYVSGRQDCFLNLTHYFCDLDRDASFFFLFCKYAQC